MNSRRRIPHSSAWPKQHVNTIMEADALHALEKIPDACIALSVTSPPYWNVIDYENDGQIGHTEYDQYIGDLLHVWREVHRVLIPNGKLAVVTPIMPIPKKVINNQHTRHLKNISSDIEQSILSGIEGFHRYSLFIWQKQTTVKMFGSYPYPPNIYEDNTMEFINVFVKDGSPPPIAKEAKEASRMTQDEWRNLTMQVWPMYPADVKRAGGHPCPFPVVLPQRLIMMYTFARCPKAGFAGDIVLDPFNGAGATCAAAKAMNRNYIGIDLNPEYCQTARHRLQHEKINPQAIFLEPARVKNPKTQDASIRKK
ncbi:MAG: site-specific DNA-methyltransferase [Candidatus Omnitrophica bacterium]|nr:site-specific DNA-methyltransferase [Candidatus Omnitrophota bacterium]